MKLFSIASLLALATAVNGAETRHKATLQSRPRVVVSTSSSVVSESNVDVKILFDQPVTALTNQGFAISATDLATGASVTGTAVVSDATDFQHYTLSFSGLQDNAEYTVSVRDSATRQCTRDSTGCTAATGAAGNVASNVLRFRVFASAVRATFAQTNQIVNSGPVSRHSLRFNRQVYPNFSDGHPSAFIVATNDATGESLRVRDLTFGQTSWTFSVAADTNTRVTVSVLQGAAADLAGNVNAASNQVSVQYAYPQNCEYEQMASPWSACTCFTGSATGTRSRTITTSISKEAFFGGAACSNAMLQPRSQSGTCTCAPANQCAGRCDGQSADGTCSCSAFCYLTGSCCSDLPQSCPQNLPECFAPEYDGYLPPAQDTETGVVECGYNALDITGAPMCYCDAYCEFEGTCCKNFSPNCNTGLCQKMNNVEAPPLLTGNVKPAFCSEEYTKGRYPGCQCDKDCINFGDCCKDFAMYCEIEDLCGREANCGKQMSKCYCDHHCTDLGDCCGDYTDVCPPHSCAEPVGPGTGCGSVARVDNFRFCSCDAECASFGDCCPDAVALCSSTW